MQTRDNRITNKLVKQGKLPKSQLEIYPQKTASKSAGFSPQQVRAIKASPKGKLPSFMAKADNNKGATYITARNKTHAATVGYDKKTKKLYGSFGKVEN